MKGRIPAIPRKNTLRPQVSSFGSVDPAPATGETDLSRLRTLLLDVHRPMFDRFRAVFALRALATDEAALTLGEAMIADRSALLRHECAYVLGQMQREAAIPQLVQTLRHDPSPMVRHEAAEALGAIGTDDVMPFLRTALLEDPATEVRESCQVALDHAQYLRQGERL